MFRLLLQKFKILSLLLLILVCNLSTAQTLDHQELIQLSALEALDLKQKQQLTTEQHVTALLEQAKKASVLNLFAILDSDYALSQANFLDSAKVDKSSPLHGIPIVISDNIDVAGLPTTLGFPMLINHIPEQTAQIIARLESHGAIVLGKTPNTPFGLEVFQESVANPYERFAVAGSSQAGTAAAVSAGIAPIGIGSDALGSARAAASLTGTIAFKPSQNRYSLDGIATTSSTETPAIFARSVKDIILVDSLLSHEQANYQNANLKDLKVGIAQDYFYYPLERTTEKLVASFLTKLIVEGEVEMIETEVNQLSDLMPSLNETLIDYELSKGISNYLDDNALNLADVLENLTQQQVLGTLEHAASITQLDYETLRDADLETLRFEFTNFIERTDIEVFILPTTPATARQIPVRESASLFQDLKDSSEFHTRNTAPGSFAGLPSITLPIGLTAEGLPVGIMLESAVGDDLRLLSIAVAIEKLIGDIPVPELP